MVDFSASHPRLCRTLGDLDNQSLVRVGRLDSSIQVSFSHHLAGQHSRLRLPAYVVEETSQFEIESTAYSIGQEVETRTGGLGWEVG